MSTVVVGFGDAGLRAATALSASGPVRLLSAETLDDGPPTGALVASGDPGELTRIWGEVVPVEADRAVAFGGQLFELPLYPPDIARMLGPKAARAAAGLLRSRLEQRLGNVFDLGNEERSYAQWLQRRLGGTLVSSLYLDYARRRYGTDPAGLSAWLGWATHSRPAAKQWFAPREGQRATRRFQRDRVLAAGGEVLEGVGVQAFELDDRRVVAVMAETGREHVDRRVWVERTPREIADLLPPDLIDEPWRYDLTRLGSAHAVEVTFGVDRTDLPFETHLLDTGPAWRILRPGVLPGESDAMIRVDLTLSEDDPLWAGEDAALVEAARASVGDLVSLGTATVRRHEHAVPISSLVTALSLGRRLDTLDAMGIVGIGARGAHRSMTPADEAALLLDIESRPAPDNKLAAQREAHRQRFERPVRLPPRASPWGLISD